MRGKLSGTGPVSALWCAIILILLVTAASAEPVKVKSNDVFVQAAPVIAEPGGTQVPLGAGAAVTTPEDPPLRNISLDFHAAEIADVLKALSLQSKTNIVTGSDVKGVVTVALNNVGLNEALDMVTKLSGFKYAMVSPNTYAVGSAQALSSVLGTASTTSASVSVEVVSLQYANGDDLAKMIPDLIPGVKASYGNVVVQGDEKKDPVWNIPKHGVEPGQERTKISAKPPRVLILVGDPESVARAKDLALKADNAAKTCGGQIVTEVYHTKYVDAEELGQVASMIAPTVSVSLGPTVNFQLSGGDYVKGTSTSVGGDVGGSYEVKAQPMTMVLNGPVDDVKRVLDAFSKVDLKPAQVLIETRIVDITNDDEKKLGVDWSWNDVQFQENTAASGAGNGNFIRLPALITAKVDAMLTNGKAKLLSNPKVAALSGKAANIFIGDQVKYVSSITQGNNGPTVTIDTLLVGIQLKAIPMVSPDNTVTLNLHPEVSTISGYSDVGNGIPPLPQVSRRFTDSTIRIASGETIVIGGLIKDQDVDNMQKLPLLGDLPFFGQLFRHRDHTKSHSDVTVFLKATIIPEQ